MGTGRPKKVSCAAQNARARGPRRSLWLLRKLSWATPDWKLYKAAQEFESFLGRSESSPGPPNLARSFPGQPKTLPRAAQESFGPLKTFSWTAKDVLLGRPQFQISPAGRPRRSPGLPRKHAWAAQEWKLSWAAAQENFLGRSKNSPGQPNLAGSFPGKPKKLSRSAQESFNFMYLSLMWPETYDPGWTVPRQPSREPVLALNILGRPKGKREGERERGGK